MADHHPHGDNTDNYAHVDADVTVPGHARRQPAYTWSFNDAPQARSPLTGRDPNFLDGLLPFYDPASARGSPDPTDYHHFYTTPYRASPSPPPPSFLDTILNPAGLDHNRFSPFSYHPPPPFTRQPFFATRDEMPPNTRARPARLPNGYVDLTSTPDSPPQRRKRQSPTPGPSAKRQKREDGPARPEGSKPLKVEEVDLTEEKEPMQEVLQKQREDAIQAQQKPVETRTTFNTFNCVICMDMPTDLTATACGKSTMIYASRQWVTNQEQVIFSATRASWKPS
jgi:hypothetical protein